MAISTSYATLPPHSTTAIETVRLQTNYRTTGPLRAEDVGPLFLALHDVANDWECVAAYLCLTIDEKNYIEYESMGKPYLALIKTLDTWIRTLAKPKLDFFTEALSDCRKLHSVMDSFRKDLKSGNVFVKFTPASPYESEALKEVLKYQLFDLKENWYEIGLGLGLTVGDLEAIKQENRNGPVAEWMRQVLKMWKSKDGNTASWTKLEYVLTKLKVDACITQDLKTKYEEALKKQTSDCGDSLSYQLSQLSYTKPYKPNEMATNPQQVTPPQQPATTQEIPREISELTTQASAKTSPVNKLTMKHLHKIEQHLPADAWEEIGKKLGLELLTQRIMQATNFIDNKDKMFSMFDHWLLMNPNAHMTTLAIAVGNAGDKYPEKKAEFTKHKLAILEASKTLFSSNT